MTGSRLLIELLERHPVFHDLEEGALERIVAVSTEIHLSEDEELYRSGQPAQHFFAVLSGALQIEYPLESESRGKVTTILLAPAVLGEAQALNERVWSGTGVAISEMIALGIRPERLLELTKAIPVLTQRLYLELAARFLNVIESWRFEPSFSPDLLVARYLLARLEASKYLKSDDDLIKISQVALARATAIRAETVNRILARWKKDGWVIKEPDGLRLSALASIEEIARRTPTPPLIARCTLAKRV